MGNVEVAYGVLYKVSAMLSQENRFSLISTRKYKKSVHNLNNFPLFTSFSLYIFRKRYEFYYTWPQFASPL